MQDVQQALSQVRDLYHKLLGRPAPEVRPDLYAAFAPGVDPVRHAVEEVGQLCRLTEPMALAPVPHREFNSPVQRFIAGKMLPPWQNVPGSCRRPRLATHRGSC